ncbi:PilZ domain-containing protein [Petrachloros mirabilis]
MEQRKHARVCVEYVFSLSGDRIRGEGVVLDLSVAGCRARSPVAVNEGEFFSVLIDVPRYETPLYVDLAVVRWVHDQEFGMEFIRMEPVHQQRLRDLVRATEAAMARRQGLKSQ